VRKALLILPVALLIVGWIWLVHRPSEVEKAVLSAAEAGALPIAEGHEYNGEVECQVEEEEAFHGQDLYLCKLGVKGLDFDLGGRYIYAAIVGGKLHTHQTDPAEIPGKVFDPSF
jgi:hypothetical protein